MPTGIGNRKVLTPRSSKVPRRSLPPQAKLVEAASFDTFDSQPSSPDIMTTKLMEKVKSGKAAAAATSKPASLNQRLNAAATTSNSLTANAGRSKLSTEEFKLDSEEDNEKYNNANSNNYSNNKNDNNKSHSSNPNNNSYNSMSKDRPSYPSKPQSNNLYNNMKNNTTSNNSSSYNNHNHSSSSSSYYNSNNSFDRWNSSFNSNNNNNNNNNNNISGSYNSSGESAELLQDQVAHLRREYENLKQRFSELSRLRLSEPEEMLEEERKLSESRDQAAEKTIKALQKENDLLKKQLAREKEEVSKLSNDNQQQPNQTTANSSLEDEGFMREVERILKIYSSFSGLKITPTPTDPLNQWHCEFSSRSIGKFAFNLIFDPALNRYQYVPILEESSSSKSTSLPAFLASDILITADQMQNFFWRLLDTLSKKPQSS